MAGLNEDVTLTVNEEPKVEKVKKKEESLSSFLPIMKCVAAALFCTFVLGCAVFSKISLISVAEQLKKGHEDNERVVIMLILILMVPQAVSFVCSAWKSLRYKNNPWPTRGAVLLGITCSILEVCGLCIFTMISLSSDVNIRGNVSIAVMNCVCMIPLFWQILKMCRNPDRFSTTSKIWKLVFGICVLLELGGLIFAIWIANMKDSRSYSVLSLLLISVAWSPQIRKWQIKPRLASGEEADEEHPIHPGQFLHKKTARTKATMISEGVKLLLTPFIGVLVSWNFGHIHPKDLHSGFEKLGQERDDIFTYFLVNIFVSLGGYVCSLIACSMAMQKIGFALPLTLTTPVSFVLATVPSLYNYFGINTDSDPKKVVPLMALVWLGQFLSTTYYVWRSQDFIMAKERQLFWVQSYNGVLLEQNLLLNRKNELTDDYFVNQHQMAKDSCVFICTTMYHEADYEMEQLLYSLHRVDSARAASNRRIESHIWFDGAVKREVLNNYVLQLISLVSKTMDVRLNHCMKLETPYGMELRWRLPGGMNFHIHLKDNIKVKNKKRWSQVMYMSYVLDYKTKQMGVREEDTYILTTDADIMFNAHSVEALLDLMMRDPKVGAVCGRTHPLGSGPLVWYQTFDYAIGHWFQKVANHVLGSVLCCPGCFSVYRAKALRDVLPLYASTADHAVDFLTKDMGEDRWLCTLMVQAGWRLEYCAAAENRTFCPDNFDEFYKQRRRWIPSTLANLALLISEWRMTVSNNDTVSFLFILYQAANVFSTLISPATVILIIVGGLKYAWSFNYIFSLLLLLFLTFFFCLICLFTSQDVQLKTAKVLTLIFSLLMGAVAVGVAEQIATGNARDGNPTPTTTPQKPTTTSQPTTKTTKKAFYDERVIPSELSLGGSNTLGKSYTSTNASYDKKDPLGGFDVSAWYLFGLIGIFMVTALCHPTEAYCLLHGIWYLLCLPSGYIFLILYSICNLTDRSWGTRENKEKSGSDESLLKVMSDRLLWLCRGCKDPEPSHEPAAAPINSDEGSSVSESSSSIESDSSSVLEVEQKSDPKEHETEQDKPPQSGQEVALDGGPTSPNRTTTMPKSALKKGGRTRPSSPGTPDDNQRRRFRFPGERTVRFPAKLPTAKTHTPVGEWLEGKMKQYKPNFEENGYDDTSFIASMKEQDLENIGINIRGHRKKILHEIEQIPIVEIDNNVPDRVDKWLADIGLHEYWLNFKNNSYTTPRDLEDLKVMNKADLEKIVREDLGIQKQGHVNKLARAIKRLQYPSAIERKIREARQVMNGVTLRRLKYDNGDDGIEFEFWSQLREARLLPESKAFGQQSDLSQKLSELRDSSVLFLFVANLLWIILIVTLLTKTNLEVPILNVNPLGLCFLVVYGFIVVIQFLTMFWHRLSTISHLLARAPFHSGATSLKVWAFNDCDLPPPPSDEELNRIRMKRERNNQRRRQRELVESFEDEERRPLVNGGYSGSYRATGTARMSPLPI